MKFKIKLRNHSSNFYFFYIYVFCTLPGIQTDKIFTEQMLIDLMNLKKRNQTSILNSRPSYNFLHFCRLQPEQWTIFFQSRCSYILGMCTGNLYLYLTQGLRKSRFPLNVFNRRTYGHLLLQRSFVTKKINRNMKLKFLKNCIRS